MLQDVQHSTNKQARPDQAPSPFSGPVPCRRHQASARLERFQVQFFYITKAIQQPFETDKRHQFVGFCGLYVLYASLYPEKTRKDSDSKKFLRQIWDVQKKVRRVQGFL